MIKMTIFGPTGTGIIWDKLTDYVPRVGETIVVGEDEAHLTVKIVSFYLLANEVYINAW